MKDLGYHGEESNNNHSIYSQIETQSVGQSQSDIFFIERKKESS